MPRSKSTGGVAVSHTSIVELQIFLNPRGRSVVNGTLVIDGRTVTLHKEISSDLKEDLEDFVLQNPTRFGLSP